MSRSLTWHVDSTKMFFSNSHRQLAQTEWYYKFKVMSRTLSNQILPWCGYVESNVKNNNKNNFFECKVMSRTLISNSHETRDGWLSGFTPGCHMGWYSDSRDVRSSRLCQGFVKVNARCDLSSTYSQSPWIYCLSHGTDKWLGQGDIDWVIDRRMSDGWTDWTKDGQTEWWMNRLNGRWTKRMTDRHTERQLDSLNGGWTDWTLDGQTQS